MKSRLLLRSARVISSHKPVRHSHIQPLSQSTETLVDRQSSIARHHTPAPSSAQSSITSSASIALAAIGFAAVAAYTFGGESRNKTDDSIQTLTSGSSIRNNAAMPESVLPGRPGNLTAEQEVKLREMWATTLKVFGVPALDEMLNGDPDSQADQRSHTNTTGSEKKKHRGMFGRKHNDKDVDSDASATEDDDKYGQAKAFDKILENQTPEELRKAFWSMVKHDNPDGLLLRFLRARKWNVHNALVMLIATMQWRMQEMHVDDDIIRRGEAGALEDSASKDSKIKKDGQDFLAQMRLGKSFLHGTDKDGRPMCFVRVRLHKQGEQSEASLERYTVYTIETARYLLSSNVDTAVSTHPLNMTNLVITESFLRPSSLT